VIGHRWERSVGAIDVPSDMFPRLKNVTIGDRNNCEWFLRGFVLPRAETITRLAFRRATCSASIFEGVTLPNIRHLELGHNCDYATSLGHLANNNGLQYLETLEFRCGSEQHILLNAVTLPRLPLLKELRCWPEQINVPLLTEVKSLKHRSLAAIGTINEEHAKEIARKCPGLRALRIDDGRELSRNAMTLLKNIPSLECIIDYGSLDGKCLYTRDVLSGVGLRGSVLSDDDLMAQ